MAAVCLPMYDWPELSSDTRQLVLALAQALQSELKLDLSTRHVPAADAGLMAVWTHPDLVVAQTCGYPLVTALRDKVTVIGTPHYNAPGCEGSDYCSHLLVHTDSGFLKLEDLRGHTAAYNSPDSQSGYNAFRHSVARLAQGKPFFGQVIETGGHVQSMQAVAAGKADICCIDAVCWGLALRVKPTLADKLRPIGRTVRVRGLPLVTARTTHEGQASAIAAVVSGVLTGPETEESRKRLGICGFSECRIEHYASIEAVRHEAAALHYPVLC